jgi:hypothetical protein
LIAEVDQWRWLFDLWRREGDRERERERERGERQLMIVERDE